VISAERPRGAHRLRGTPASIVADPAPTGISVIISNPLNISASFSEESPNLPSRRDGADLRWSVCWMEERARRFVDNRLRRIEIESLAHTVLERGQMTGKEAEEVIRAAAAAPLQSRTARA
jgi:hypothetical protein